MRALLASLVFLVACGSGSRRGGADEPIIDTADRISGLPAPTQPLGGTSERFQEIWTAAQLAIEVPLPAPDVADESVYTEWIERRLSRWLGERADAIARVKDRLRELGSAPADEQMMAAGVLGFLMEDTARQVLEAPVPVNARRPERAEALREALSAEVDPLYAAAIEAYRMCGDVEGGSAPHLAAWREYCDGRKEALREER